MAFDFPSSPTVGQSYTPAGGPTYVWDGFAWANADTIAAAKGWWDTGLLTLPTNALYLDVPLPPGTTMIDVSLDGMSAVTTFTAYVQLLDAVGAPTGSYVGSVAALGAAAVATTAWPATFAQLSSAGFAATSFCTGNIYLRRCSDTRWMVNANTNAAGLLRHLCFGWPHLWCEPHQRPPHRQQWRQPRQRHLPCLLSVRG